MFACQTAAFHVTVSGDDLQPVQAANIIAADDATVRQGGKAPDTAVDFEPCDFAPRGYVPQPDRVVPGARGEPPVRQCAQRIDRTLVPFEAGALGAGSHVPEPDDRVVP